MNKAAFHAFIALVFLFLLLPLVTVVIGSFASSAVMVFPPQGFTTRWYFEIPPEFYDSAQISLITAVCTAVVASLVGTPTALALVRGRFPGKAVLNAICLSPLSVPSLVFAVAAFQFTTTIWKIAGFALDDTITGLVLAQSALGIPFVIRAVIAAHANFDGALEEASLSLGATPAYTFVRVTLPLLLPGIVSGAVFAFMMSFDDVTVALFLGGANVTTLPVKIFTSIEFSLDVWVMAVASLVILVSLVVLIVIDRLVGFEKFYGTTRTS